MERSKDEYGDLVYTVAETQKLLKISRTMAYELANSGAFNVIRIGKTMRVPAKSFHEWLEKDKSTVSH